MRSGNYLESEGLSIGIAGKGAGKLQAGGGDIDLSLSNLSQLSKGLHAFAFHAITEETTRTGVNQSLIHGDENARKQAMAIYDFEKTVVYDLNESDDCKKNDC